MSEETSSYEVGGTHYTAMPIQPWDVMRVVLTPEEFRGFCKGCAIKYAMRAGHKPGTLLGDEIGKFRHYAAKLQEADDD